MIRNFFKITLRNLWKDKSGSFINILGFSTGLAAFLIIVAYVRHEMSYENFNVHADRICRIDLQMTVGDKEKIATVSPNILGPGLKGLSPEVVNYVRIFNPSIVASTQITYEGESFMTDKFFYADSTLFDVFTVPVLDGSSKGFLCHKNELIISESAANKYFGGTHVEGRFITVNGFDGQENYMIRGVFRDFPSNSHIHPEFIGPVMNCPIGGELKWDQINYYTYLLLNSPAALKPVESRMTKYIQANIPEYYKSLNVKFSLIPLRDIHLYSNAEFEPEPVGDINQVIIFMAVGIFILVLAIINYINMATAKSIERAKEVGLRKIMGSFRIQIIQQYLGESAIITLAAILFALLIAISGKPYIAALFHRSLDFGFLGEPVYIGILGLIWVLISLISGIYPAFVLSAFEPAYVMKGSFKRSTAGSMLRKGLVTFQFLISISIIAGTLIVYRQLNFMQNQKLGFDKDKLLAISVVKDPSGKTDIDGFKKQLLMRSNIEDVSITSAYPTHNLGGDIAWGEGMNEKDYFLIWGWEVDEDFIKTLGVKLLEGKNFNPEDRDTTQSEFLINETAMKRFGWDLNNCIGKKIIRNGEIKGRCIGVVQDFNFNSLKLNIEPLILYQGQFMRNNVLVRLNGTDIRGTLNYISDQWKSRISSVPIDYHFVDQQYNALYDNETSTGRFFTVFAVIAIIIACLGLFALSTYETITRTKEIGIRKALGSSALGIFSLLVKNFSLQVFLSFFMAIPLSWYLMNHWLEAYAYRIQIGPLIFILTGAIIFMITFLTVGYHSLRAAFRNPVLSLRYE